MTHWIAVTLDLHETYGVDTDSDILDHRNWLWLRDRIIGLIDKPTRLRAALHIPADATTAA